KRACLITVELRVSARNGHVVEENVAVGVPATGCHIVVKQKSGTRVRATPNYQQRRAGGQGARNPGGYRIVVSFVVLCAQRVGYRAEVQSPRRRHIIEWGKLVVLGACHRTTSWV